MSLIIYAQMSKHKPEKSQNYHHRTFSSAGAVADAKSGHRDVFQSLSDDDGLPPDDCNK